jgi:DNA adenine methylase
MMNAEIKRPVLDYFGGKFRISKKVIEHLPKHEIYIEPMCGAASVLLRKPPSDIEVINDVHGDVVNFFRVLRDNYEELQNKLKLTPYAREEYYSCKEKTNCPIEQARRTYVRSWLGIGNSIHKHNGFQRAVSKKTAVRAWINHIDGLEIYANRLRSVVIENIDYRQIISKYDRYDSLFYVDPPYLLCTRKGIHKYLHEWNDEDHEELVEILKTIKGKCVLSGLDNKIYDQLTGWKKVQIPTRNRCNHIVEFLWIKGDE